MLNHLFIRKNINDAGLNVASIKGQANPSKSKFIFTKLGAHHGMQNFEPYFLSCLPMLGMFKPT